MVKTCHISVGLEVTFKLSKFVVPTLVIKGNRLSQPIIGSNVIRLIVDTELQESKNTDINSS